VIENHPHRSLADFRRKLVRCLARHGSTFSGVGASDKPGAVQITPGPKSLRFSTPAILSNSKKWSQIC
jgi:hypothetical protein